MRTFNIVFIVLFTLFAALQYNDPDPLVWMLIYLYAAFLCFLAVRGKQNLTLVIIGLAIYSLYAVYLFVGNDGVLSWATKHNAENIAQSMKAQKPWIEETREFFGLLIVIVVLLVNLFHARRQEKIISKTIEDLNGPTAHTHLG